MDNISNNERREPSGEKNMRFLGYHFLKDIKFSGQPVVPKIISEGEDVDGTFFMVEKLDGMDLDDFLRLPESEVSLKDKFSVMLHITQQYEAVDEAGFVLFDRHAFNIRVLNWKAGEISTRQVDVDQIYDKKTDASYSMDDQDRFESMNDSLNKLGRNLWQSTIVNLISQELKIVDIGRHREIVELLRKEKEITMNKGTSLDIHEMALRGVVSKFD